MFIIFLLFFFFFFFFFFLLQFQSTFIEVTSSSELIKNNKLTKKKKKKCKNKILTTIQFTPPRLYSHLLFILYFQYLNQPYEGIIHVLNFNKNIYHNQTFPLMKLSKHFLNHNLMSFLQNRSCFGFVRY